MANSLMIAGIDYWSRLERDTLRIDQRMTYVVDQCSFSLLGHKPAEGEEVIITRRADSRFQPPPTVIETLIASETATAPGQTGSPLVIPIAAAGRYKMVIAGAAGIKADDTLYSSQVNSFKAGKGAEMTAEFDLAEGDVLTVIVGKMGEYILPPTIVKDMTGGPGGGGTFVFKDIPEITNTVYQFTKSGQDYEVLLVAAGGGGTADINEGANAMMGSDGKGETWYSPGNTPAYSRQTANGVTAANFIGGSIAQVITYDAIGGYYTKNGAVARGGYGCGGAQDRNPSGGGGWIVDNSPGLIFATSWSAGENTSGKTGDNDAGGYFRLYLCTVEEPDDDARIMFAGIVTKSVLSKRSADHRVPVYDVECDDYTALLDGKLVVETYKNTPADVIFKDIVTKYITGFTVDGVMSGAPSIENTGTDLAYVRPSEAFKYLCDYVGWQWEPTYTKDLRFFKAEDLYTPAPMDLVPGGRFTLGKHTVDINGLRNRVYVIGGSMLSDLQEIAWLADGVGRVWVIPFGPHDLSFFIGLTSYSVGIENLHDEADYDFMMSFSEKYIRCSEQTPTPYSGAQLRLIARQDIPVVTVFEDLGSQAALRAIQGGDGVYEHVITDNSLVTVQAAEAIGDADLKLHANPTVSGDFTTEVPGWYPGQIVAINLPHRGINNSFVVQRVQVERILDNPDPDSLRWRYTITYGGRLLGLADFLQSLVSRQQREKGEETSVINKMVFSDDKIPMTDEGQTAPAALPYKYTEPRSVWEIMVTSAD